MDKILDPQVRRWRSGVDPRPRRRGRRMKRRELLALIGGAAALAPFGATAQPGLPVIGYLSNRSAEAETPLRTGFLEGLEQRGFVVGRNVAIEYRFAEGSLERLPSLATELIGLPAALLVATGRPRQFRRRRQPQPSRSSLPSASTRCSWASSPASTGRPATRRESTCSRPRQFRSAWNCCARSSRSPV